MCVFVHVPVIEKQCQRPVKYLQYECGLAERTSTVLSLKDLVKSKCKTLKGHYTTLKETI